MKFFSIIHILLFLLLMIIYQCTSAQGYIVMAAGDTIQGEVKPQIFGVQERVQVTTADRKKTTYSILQVKSFSYKNDLYRAVRTDKRYTYMKVIIPGYLSLYGFQPENQTGYDAQYLQKQDGQSLEIPNLNFKKYMKTFLEDCPAVVAQIDSGSLGRRDVVKIVTEYNNCVEDRTKRTKEISAQIKENNDKLSSWNLLEAKVKAAEFTDKATALEMITEVRNKLSKNENIPNFLIEGLKSALVSANVKEELDNALNDLKK
jgi:hypothetical protein